MQQFKDDGYCYLRKGFDPEVAAACRDLIWDSIEKKYQGVQRDTPESYKKVPKLRLGISECYRGLPWDMVWSSRLQETLNEICGPCPLPGLGWWTIAFPMADDGHWHIDALRKDTRALLFLLFSDLEPKGGGTRLALGSHRVAAQLLQKHQDMNNTDLSSKLSASDFPIHTIHGMAGDLVIVHPLLLHARSKNQLQTVRFLCHPTLRSSTETEDDILSASLGFTEFKSSSTLSVSSSRSKKQTPARSRKRRRRK